MSTSVTYFATIGSKYSFEALKDECISLFKLKHENKVEIVVNLALRDFSSKIFSVNEDCRFRFDKATLSIEVNELPFIREKTFFSVFEILKSSYQGEYTTFIIKSSIGTTPDLSVFKFF